MSRSRPYHLGDTIHILRPHIVRRVGYPLHFRDLELQQEAAMRLSSTDATALGFRDMQLRQWHPDLINGLAKALVADRGFGGQERVIKYYQIVDKPHPLGASSRFSLVNDEPKLWERIWTYDCTGEETTVESKCVRMTGTRYAGGGGYDYNGNYEWENGGLTNQQAHVFLYTSYGWVEQVDVELVKPFDPNCYHLSSGAEYQI